MKKSTAQNHLQNNANLASPQQFQATYDLANMQTNV